MKECTQCGRCCTNADYMGHMQASAEDLARWKKQKRHDILAYADEYFGIADLWISPRTGESMERCPFVRKQRGIDRYTCLIYDTRPEVCRGYPWWVAQMRFVDCEMLEPGDTDADVEEFMEGRR